MRRITAKIKPTSGFSHVLHIGLLVLLPALVFVLVRMRFYQLGLTVILLSKWRMLAVKPRHWPANIRANAVDLTVGISVLVFMMNSGSQLWQLIWAVVYGIWLVLIKPASSVFAVSGQALLAQVAGLMALFIAWPQAPIYGLVGVAWLICYTTARHFFSSFDEPLTRLFSYSWAYFAAALVWVLSHWLLFYETVAQPTLLLMVIGFSLSGLYYLEETDRLSVFLRRQFIFIMVAIIIIVIAFSDWGDKTI